MMTTTITTITTNQSTDQPQSRQKSRSSSHKMFHFSLSSWSSTFCLIAAMLILVTVITSAGVTQAKSSSRKDKMLRLCLWTQCRPATWSKKCPSYLEQSAKRKCKLGNGDIGFYSKCCLYEEQILMKKSI